MSAEKKFKIPTEPSSTKFLDQSGFWGRIWGGSKAVERPANSDSNGSGLMGTQISRRRFLALSLVVGAEVAGTGIVSRNIKKAADKSVTTVIEEPTNVAANRTKAEQIGRELGSHIRGTGRTQLSLDGMNPDLCFKPANISGEDLPHPNHEYSEQLKRELKTPHKLADPETGQQLNAIIANEAGKFDAEGKLINGDEVVTVYFGAYRNGVNYRESNYRVGEMAHQMSDRVLFGFDVPNMGDSDALTDAQQDGLAEGRFDEVVDAHLRILAEKGIKKINLSGFSMGARVALTTAVRAAEHDIEVENVLLYDTPGVDEKDIEFWDLYGRLGEENKYLDLYHSNHFDNTLFEAAGLDRPQHERFLENAWFIASNFDEDPWVLYARACGKATVDSELGQVFENTNANVLLVNGQDSKVSPKEDVLRIRNKYKGMYGSRMGTNFFEGVGHYAFAHPKDIAFNMKLNLENAAV